MPSRKWLIALLIVSLAVNLALGGFLIGQMSRPERPAMLDPSLSLFRVVRELPEARREAFRPTLRAHFRELRADIRRLRDAQRGIDAALSRQPFHPEALTEALAQFRAALLDSQQRNHRLLVDVAATMSAEERALLLEAMERRRPLHRHRSEQDRGNTGAPAPQRPAGSP